jgi:hypothetical protein
LTAGGRTSGSCPLSLEDTEAGGWAKGLRRVAEWGEEDYRGRHGEEVVRSRKSCPLSSLSFCCYCDLHASRKQHERCQWHANLTEIGDLQIMPTTRPKHWQSLMGTFEFEPEAVVYKGGQFTDSETQQVMPAVGFAICDVLFSGGSLAVDVGSAKGGEIPSAQIIVSHDPARSEMFTAGVVATGTQARFSFSVFPGFGAGTGWAQLASTPDAPREPGRPIGLRVETRGSVLDLFADDVHVLRHVIPGKVPTAQCGVWARSKELVTFRNFRVDVVEKTAFVVMQFSEPYNDLYQQVIIPVARECGVGTKRADDTAGPGVILADIIKQIQTADLIIAEITPTNPNVFYEVGYAHALNKPTILIAEKGRQLPFDLSSFRTLFYENSIAGKKRIEDGLRAHIKAIFNS